MSGRSLATSAAALERRRGSLEEVVVVVVEVSVGCNRGGLQSECEGSRMREGVAWWVAETRSADKDRW